MRSLTDYTVLIGMVVFCECAALWCAIAATMRCFSQASRMATVMMAPYLLWVSFALVLNAAIWHLNR